MWKVARELPKEKLEALYQEHTDKEIAEQYGVTENAIRRLRVRRGIETIPQWKRRQIQNGGSKGARSLEDLTPSILADLYTQMGDREIGALYGVSKTAISHRRKKWGIQPLTKSDRATHDGELTPDQIQICVGTMLGDGYLRKCGALRIGHAWHQLDYLRWLHRMLHPLSRPIRYSEKTVSTGTLCFTFTFQTVQHAWFKTLRDVFYPEGRRIFPASVLESLEPLGLAVWYFDDGHLGDGLPSFALGDITQSEAEGVCRLVQERFGLDTYVRPQSTPTCKIMGVRARSADIFFHLVRSYATPDMITKLPARHRPRGVFPKKSHSVSEEKLDPSLGDQCRKWEFLLEDERESLLDRLVAYWQERGFPHYNARPEELEVLMSLEPHQMLRGDGLSWKQRAVGQATCQSFATHIWEARSWGSKRSPREIFDDPTSLRKAIQARIRLKSKTKYGAGPVSAAEIRSSLRSWRLSGVYNFRPSVAKCLVDLHGRPGGVVYDPCAGYGGRLLGCVLSKHGMQYVGCDPNREGIVRLEHMVQWMGEYIPQIPGRVELHPVPAESFDVPECDLVLTSPPYWRREVYDDSPEQSSHRYPTYESWLSGFWGAVLERSYQALRPGGWMLLNVDDFSLGKTPYPLVADTTRLCLELGLRLDKTYVYEMPRFRARGNHESVLAFEKPGEARKIPVSPGLSVSRCKTCGKAVPEGDLRGGECVLCGEKRGFPVECEGCGVEFQAKRETKRFCSNTCYARHRRALAAKDKGPVTRTFTCQDCGESWSTEEHGNFKWCAACREKREIAKRTKTCAYRHCGCEFVDTTPKSSMSYCHPEHRRREKLFRSGKARDLSYFKKPDPVTGD
jgi:hypothetical protein